MKKFNRIICSTIILVMLLSTMSIGAFAETTYNEIGQMELSEIYFADMDKSDWYYEAVQYVVGVGFFKGIGNNRFGPDLLMTRAMFVTVLGRNFERTGGIIEDAESSYADVSYDVWFTKYVAWAEKNSLVKGYGDGMFGPNDYINREQLAVMLIRYAQFTGKTLLVVKDEFKFSDAASISSYASDAVKMTQRAGLLSGLPDGTFGPKKYASRAEVAAVFMRLAKL